MPIETSIRWKATEDKQVLLELDSNGKTAYAHSRFLKPDALRELGEACYQAAQMIEAGYTDFIPCFESANKRPECEQPFSVPQIQRAMPHVAQPFGVKLHENLVQTPVPAGMNEQDEVETNDEPLPPVAGSQAVNPVFARKERERSIPKPRRASAPVQPGGNGYQATH